MNLKFKYNHRHPATPKKTVLLLFNSRKVLVLSPPLADLKVNFVIFEDLFFYLSAFAEIDWSLETLRLRFMSAIPNTTQVSGNTSCGVPTEETWHIFRDAKTSDLPWPGSIFGTLVLGGYFWCTNQVRVLLLRTRHTIYSSLFVVIDMI